MKIVQFQRTKCPKCGSTSRHRIYATRTQGIIVVRYHYCECGEQFRSDETGEVKQQDT